jgi:hypothetical protein
LLELLTFFIALTVPSTVELEGVFCPFMGILLLLFSSPPLEQLFKPVLDEPELDAEMLETACRNRLFR